MSFFFCDANRFSPIGIGVILATPVQYYGGIRSSSIPDVAGIRLSTLLGVRMYSSHCCANDELLFFPLNVVDCFSTLPISFGDGFTSLCFISFKLRVSSVLFIYVNRLFCFFFSEWFFPPRSSVVKGVLLRPLRPTLANKV